MTIKTNSFFKAIAFLKDAKAQMNDGQALTSMERSLKADLVRLCAEVVLSASESNLGSDIGANHDQN